VNTSLYGEVITQEPGRLMGTYVLSDFDIVHKPAEVRVKKNQLEKYVLFNVQRLKQTFDMQLISIILPPA